MKNKLAILLIFSLFFIAWCSKTNNKILDKDAEELVTYSENEKMNQETVEKIIDKFNVCEEDSDCKAFYWQCPLGCHLAVNEQYYSDVQKIINNRESKLSTHCVYDCVAIAWASCVSNKCIAIPEATPENAEISYDNTLIVAWVGPDTSFEQVAWEDTLVLHKVFEEHSDHLFIQKELWSEFIDDDYLILPWNNIHFKWIVRLSDAWAWNYYYDVVFIDKLEKVGDPSKQEIEDIIKSYGFCEKNEDCVSFYWECPFACHQSMNVKYEAISKEIMNNFLEKQEEKCIYKCMEIKATTCEKYQCKAN